MKISKSKLKTRVSSHEGVVKVFSIDLDEIECSSVTKEELQDLKNEMRALLRVEQNFDEAISMLSELEAKLQEDNYHYSFSHANRALFATAVVLYGACFVRGGSRKDFPLKNIPNDFVEEKIHKDTMLYRHKLLSHLDEDHKVRTDKLGWDMHVISDQKLKPFGPHLNGDKVLMEMGGNNLKLIDHMKKIIIEMNVLKQDLTNKINLILGEEVNIDLDILKPVEFSSAYC